VNALDIMPIAEPKLPSDLPITQPRYVGKDSPRMEDPLLVTGRVEYGNDIRSAEMLHAAILRSPHAHALIKSIDTRRAEKLPGVAAVLTGKEVKAWSRPVFGVPEGWTGYALAVEKTHWAGEPVAVVAASDRYIAEDALELIDVEYEPLEPVTDAVEAAMGRGPCVLEGKESNVVYDRRFQFGDTTGAFASADLIVRERFRWHRSSGNPLETCVCIADWNPFTGMLTLRGSHRSPHLILPALVASLGVSSQQVRIIQSPLGGSFGVKTFARYVVLLSLLAKKLGGRAVKWTEDRIEHLLGSSTHAWDRHYTCELALKGDGTITGMKMEMIDDLGAFSEWLAVGMLLKPLLCLGSCYHIPNIEYACKGVTTNKAPQGPLRAFGLPPHFWIIEQLLDTASHKLGIERTELRRRNFIRKDQFPYVSPSGNVYDSGDYEASLDLLLHKADYDRLLREQREARAAGRLLGIGIAGSIEPGLTGPPMLALAAPRIFSRTSSPEGILVRIDSFGKIIAELGFPPGGQSQHSFVRQILADYFSVALEDVQVITVDSLSMQPSTGPISSSMAIALSGAVLGAAARLAQKMATAAAVMLEAGVDDIEFMDGQFRVCGVPGKTLPVVRVAQFMLARPDLLPQGVDGNPQATYVWNPPDRTIPDDRGFGRYSVTAAGAQHLCMVEVDRETGQVKILKYVMVDDCGVRLNPSVVRGMLMGGMAHGVGTALLEEYVYDEQGQMLTSSYMDYLMPTIMEVPAAEEHEMCTPSPIAPLGVKGVGEGALHTTPAAVLCAVNDALAPLGVQLTEVPMSPLRVWNALQAVSRSQD